MTDPNDNWRHKVSEQLTPSGLDETACCVSSGAGYRLLKPGERLQKHDEGLHEEDGKWHEVDWLFSACDYVPGFMVPIRRKCEHCTEGYVQDAGFVECNHCNSPHAERLAAAPLDSD